MDKKEIQIQFEEYFLFLNVGMISEEDRLQGRSEGCYFQESAGTEQTLRTTADQSSHRGYP